MLSSIAENQQLIIVPMFFAFSVLEVLAPVRELTLSIIWRWFTNFSLYALNTAGSIGLHLLPGLWAANWTAGNQFGLFSVIEAPFWIIAITGLLVLDVCHYLIHRAMHKFSWLWRIHMVHHTDIEVDISTSFRFHPGEAMLSLAAYLLVILLLGLPEESAFVFWVLLNFSNLLSHANVFVPEALDRWLQHGIITASTHRLHHSVGRMESNKNFGSIFIFWDKLFGTYLDGSGEAQRNLIFGLPEHRGATVLYLPRLLLMPFVAKPANTPKQDPQQAHL